MSDQTTYERLAARFEPGEHKTKTIGGTGLTYVDGETVVTRLNEVLGFDGWSFEVTDVTVLEDEVYARGRLTVYVGERTVIREQAGGQIINRTRSIPARPAQEADGDRPAIPAQPAQKGQIIELSNDIKGAITDCLKKCATLVGVGLYLYDPVERAEVKAEMDAARRSGSQRPNQPAPSGPRPTPSSPDGASSTAAGSNEAKTPPAPKPAGYFCIECHGLVKSDTSVTILKKKDGPKVSVAVAEFAPVCEQRLGGFHCPACYDKKYWGAA